VLTTRVILNTCTSGEEPRATNVALFAPRVNRTEVLGEVLRDSRKGPKTIVPAKGERLIWLERATCPKSVRDDGGIACTGALRPEFELIPDRSRRARPGSGESYSDVIIRVARRRARRS
jgi:hypothetical protein